MGKSNHIREEASWWQCPVVHLDASAGIWASHVHIEAFCKHGCFWFCWTQRHCIPHPDGEGKQTAALLGPDPAPQAAES